MHGSANMQYRNCSKLQPAPMDRAQTKIMGAAYTHQKSFSINLTNRVLLGEAKFRPVPYLPLSYQSVTRSSPQTSLSHIPPHLGHASRRLRSVRMPMKIYRQVQYVDDY